MTVSAGNVIPSQKIIFPLSVATGSTRPIDYSKRIDFERLFPIFGHRLFEKNWFRKIVPDFWDVSTRWRQKAGILFSGGMTFPAETVIRRSLIKEENVFVLYCRTYYCSKIGATVVKAEFRPPSRGLCPVLHDQVLFWKTSLWTVCNLLVFRLLSLCDITRSLARTLSASWLRAHTHESMCFDCSQKRISGRSSKCPSARCPCDMFSPAKLVELCQ